MGFETDAERNRDAAIESINSAIKNLSNIVIDKCSGYNDYKSSYISTLQSAMMTLLDVRNELE